MSAVYTFGETVYDIVFKKGQPVAARAGGAMLNTAVSLGRAGQKVFLLTETGDDLVGNNISNFLEENGVDTTYIQPYPNASTPVALAFLDDQGAASYSFYKNYPKVRLGQDFPIPGPGDAVLFGSFYSLSPGIRDKLAGFIRMARQAGAIIIYDPNIRKNHMDELAEVFHYVLDNISSADIVRGSDEDFMNLFKCCEDVKVFNQIQELGCQYLILTNARGATLSYPKGSIHVAAKKTKPVSTIGAGDSFNAGLIFSILNIFEQKPGLDSLDDRDWKIILETANAFAASTCKSLDNYISKEFAEKIRQSAQ